MVRSVDLDMVLFVRCLHISVVFCLYSVGMVVNGMCSAGVLVTT